MQKFNKIVMLSLAAVLALGVASGCGPTGGGELGDYTPRFPTDYDENINSWEQVDPADEDVTITWFFDYGIADENLEDLIYQRTGVNVNIQSASTNNHEEINTMISDNRLPDVITLSDSSLRILLAEEGYCLPLNQLAQYYAPGMLKTVPEDHWSQYRASDGNTYALSSNFYSDAEIEQMEDLGAHSYARRDVAVRKDYLEAYIAYKKSLDPSFDENSTITRPSGFIEMCNWVKNEYGYTIANPTVVFSPFNLTGDELSQALTALYEMFGYAPEDAEGNITNMYTSPEFREALDFMNTLYNNGFVSSQNFGWDIAKIGTEVKNGNPFCIIGATQNTHFQQGSRELDHYDAATDTVPSSAQYVTILLTNEEGEAPLLSDYNGKGVYQTMITKNCKREDRVIKVFDYLLSEQGQREAIYGAEENYEFEVEPGEIDPDTGKPSLYGVIRTTKALRDLVPTMFKNRAQAMGIRRVSAFASASYGRMVSKEDDFIGIKHPVDWILYQNKKTYFGYTYNMAEFDFYFDEIDRKTLNNYATQEAAIFEAWANSIASIIMAKSKDEMNAIIDATLQECNNLGMEEWMSVRNEYFKRYKASRGVEFAYPKNRADYVAPEVRLTGGLYETIERPDYVYEVLS